MNPKSPYEIRGIKDRLKNMSYPPPGHFDSLEKIEGYLYGVAYSATIGDLGKEDLKLAWVISIYGSKKNCARALEDFVSEMGGPPIKKLEIPGLNTKEMPSEILGIYFWEAQEVLH